MVRGVSLFAFAILLVAVAYGFHWTWEDRSIKFADELAVRSSCGSAAARIAPGRYKSIASRVVSRVCPTSLQTWRSFASGPSGIMMNRLWHIAYKVSFRMARLLWWLRHPDHDGAIVAIWFEGHVLVVRQSYRTNLTFPGGGIRRGEGPRDAARREVAEEIGLVVRRDDLRLVQDTVSEWDFRCDCVRIFELHLRAAPHVKIDGREIIDARFVDPQRLLAEQGIPPFIRDYVFRVCALAEQLPMGDGLAK